MDKISFALALVSLALAALCSLGAGSFLPLLVTGTLWCLVTWHVSGDDSED
jgi:hypothetical protein